MTYMENPVDEKQKEILIEKAKSMLSKSYCPYSKFAVGAAILGANGVIYTGCNVENASFGATICAERSAMVKAVTDGCTKISAVAIVSSSGKKTYPCGICRQFLSEFADDKTVVLLCENDRIYTSLLSQMLPEQFSL